MLSPEQRKHKVITTVNNKDDTNTEKRSLHTGTSLLCLTMWACIRSALLGTMEMSQKLGGQLCVVMDTKECVIPETKACAAIKNKVELAR